MSEYFWRINGTSAEQLGLAVASVDFTSRGSSSAQLQVVDGVGDAAVFTYGQSILIERSTNGSTWARFFQGTIEETPRNASGRSQSQGYIVRDAWYQLERLIYQEPWAVGASGTILMPRFVFGMDATGARITVGAQIAEVVDYAASKGVAIAAGTMQAGEIPIPSEMRSTTCAEIILQCLRLHPDWMIHIDHTQVVPTLNVTAAGSASATTIGISSCEQVSITKRDDLLPDAVRIIYETSSQVDGEVYRSLYVDAYPSDLSTPQTIQHHVELQGSQMQIQKSRIQTETIPTSQSAAKPWLKTKIPQLKDVPDAAFTVTQFDRVLVDDGAMPDPINPNAERLSVTTPSDLPRELVRGQIEDWMRVKVGQVKFKVAIQPTGTATDADRKAIGTGDFHPFIVTCTNATTKIYKGVSSWTAAEDVPVGIAEATYNAIHDGCALVGSVTTLGAFVGVNLVGRVLNITGGAAEWSSMAAPVHDCSFDFLSDRVTIAIGMPPAFTPNDFLELQRAMRWVPTRWFSSDERTSNKAGDEAGASSKGDTVTGFDQPIMIVPPPTIGSEINEPFQVTQTEASPSKLKIESGYYKNGAGATPVKLDSIEATGTHAYLRIEANGTASLSVQSSALATLEYSGTSPFAPIRSNVLLAYVDGSNNLIRLRSGNQLISYWAINGWAALWSESIGGER